MPVSLLLAAIILTAACARPQRPPDGEARGGIAAAAEDSLVGSFHIIFDAGPRYFLITDSATSSTELRFSGDYVESPSSLLKFDRKRVRVFGTRGSGDTRLFHVSRIELHSRETP